MAKVPQAVALFGLGPLFRQLLIFEVTGAVSFNAGKLRLEVVHKPVNDLLLPNLQFAGVAESLSANRPI
jgi:hypothetical protein